MLQKGFAPVLVVIILAIVVLGGGYFVFTTNYSNNRTKLTPSPKACTEEAKVCPDGTSVGRTGPNCEFAQCPAPKESSPSANMTNWKTYTNMKYAYTMKYPQAWQIQEDVPSPYDANKPGYTFFFTEKQEFLPGLRIYVSPITTPEQWIGENIQFGRSEKIIVASSQAVKLRGIPEGIENEYAFLDKSAQTIVFFASGVETLRVFDQILSTFKFTQ